VRIEPDSLIAAQISFDSRSNTISYSGERIESVTSVKMVQIKITLVNPSGENTYSQTVMVFFTATNEPTEDLPSDGEEIDDSAATEEGSDQTQPNAVDPSTKTGG